MGYPFLIWNVIGSIPIRSKVHLSHYLLVRIKNDVLYDMIDSNEDVKEAEDKYSMKLLINIFRISFLKR